MAIIDVNGLTYTYPGMRHPALENVSLQIGSGQLIAIIGANGAGKSTLLLALAGFIPSLFHGETHGNVTILGLDTQSSPPGSFAGKVGLVLQNPSNQLSGMRHTVYEEVAWGLENMGIARADMPKRIDRVLEQVGLSDLGDRSPYSLSSGQQQRVALAAILVMEPSIILLDEPTSTLDPQGSQAIYNIIQDLSRQGRTIIIPDQHLEWIANSADRVIALENGKVVLDGPGNEVLTSPVLNQIGVGWLRYTYAAHKGFEKDLWSKDLELPITLQQAQTGFITMSSKNKG